MAAFNIEKYINSLPDDIETIDVSSKSLTYLPSLERFHKLKELYCSHNKLTLLPELNLSLQGLYCYNNQLTTLPALNPSLQRLNCYNNQLTSLLPLNPSLQRLDCSHNKLTLLPALNPSLQRLWCDNNQLTSLPELNPSLQFLYCHNNQLTSLPELNPSLQRLYCHNNLLPISINQGWLNAEQKNTINNAFQCIERFKMMFYCLKYKTKLRDWLWLKVRLPKIERLYHPNNLNKLLNADMSEEELDNVLSIW